MPVLKGKKILLGVSGSIAAYKAAYLVRLLVKEGAEVKVVMTPCAEEFITATTLSTLSRNPVYRGFFNSSAGEEYSRRLFVDHVELSRWADILLVAPATANTIACFANGLCQNVLHAVYLSAKCPVYMAPAMDEDMYSHVAVKKNLSNLQNAGNIIIPCEKGDLASGLSGEGRMAEPDSIVKIISAEKKNSGRALNSLNKSGNELSGIRCLVTAGPTWEFIDPVRFIGNPSSGKMGFAIAETLAGRGADVILISGPSQLHLNSNRIKRIDVTSAEEMHKNCLDYFSSSDVVVMAAAISDYSPVKRSIHKIKKKKENHLLELEPATDILKEMGLNKKKNQILVGFALETDNQVENARQKLKNKNLDFIVLNSPGKNGTGFGFDTNRITIIERGGKRTHYELKPKTEAAEDIVDRIVKLIMPGQIFHD